MNEARGDTGRMADLLRETIDAYVAAQNHGDAKAVLRHFHKSSPTYESTRQAVNHLYLNFKLNCELLGTSFVGSDESYACVRVRQRTAKVEGPQFRDNVTEMLVVLREDEGAWRIWSQALLSAELASFEGATPDGR